MRFSCAMVINHSFSIQLLLANDRLVSTSFLPVEFQRGKIDNLYIRVEKYENSRDLRRG